MKKIILISIVFFISVMSLSAKSLKVMAIVEADTRIFSNEVENKIKFLQVMGQYSPSFSEEYILQRVILEHLLDREIAKYKFTPPDIKDEDIKSFVTQGLNESWEDLEKRALNKGFTKTQFLFLLRKDMIYSGFQNSIAGSRVAISAKEVEEEISLFSAINGKYEYEISRIIIYKGNDAQKAKKRITSVLQKLKLGENFASLAIKYSEDFLIREYKYIKVSETFFPQEIQEQIDALANESYTNIIEYNDSYQIYYLKNKSTAINFNSNDISHLQSIENLALNKLNYLKVQVVLQQYLESLKTEYSIYIVN